MGMFLVVLKGDHKHDPKDPGSRGRSSEPSSRGAKALNHLRHADREVQNRQEHGRMDHRVAV